MTSMPPTWLEVGYRFYALDFDPWMYRQTYYSSSARNDKPPNCILRHYIETFSQYGIENYERRQTTCPLVMSMVNTVGWALEKTEI